MVERYSAHLRVNRTVVPERKSENTTSRMHHTTGAPPPKKETESVEITVRAATLEKLSEKVAAHLALLDSDDFITEPIPEATCR